MSFNIGNIQKATSPNPFALISTKKPDKTTNLMAISWWMFVSNHPAQVAVCTSKKGYTGEIITETGEFGLNIVDDSLKDEAFLCGTCSGRTENKAEKFNIELIEAKEISAKLIKAHKVAMECKLVDILELSDHIIYVGEVVDAHTNIDRKQLFSVDGYKSLDTL